MASIPTGNEIHKVSEINRVVEQCFRNDKDGKGAKVFAELLSSG